MIRTRRLAVVWRLAIAALAAAAGPSASAQDFPKGTVRLIVPFTAGGPTDTIARLMSIKLQEMWAQPVVVEYKPGAGTVIGIDHVAKSAADGQTIGIVVSSYSINPVLRKAMPYDTLKDLSGVTRLTSFPLGLVAHPSVPFDDLKGLVAYAKANPGKLAYATPGAGGTSHLAVELLKGIAGIDLLHVPYKGSAPAQTDVMGGRVPLMSDPLFSAMPFVRAGKMKVIAVSTARRVPGFEQFPTVAETFPGFDVVAYLGFVVPSATPRAVVRKIQADSVRAINLPDVKARIDELGNQIVGSTPEEFDAFVAADMKKWAKVIRDANIPQE
jgi:tripartite-type tricarboxylate transporter receptor subunit TctC